MAFVKISVLVFALLALAACSISHQYPLNAGAADYRHYPTGGGLYVSATFAADGKLWRVVPEQQHVYVDYSSDLGKTFSPPALVNAEPQTLKVSGENRPGIAVDSTGLIYVMYAAEGTQPSAVYTSVSTDNGRSFTTPVPISDRAAEANTYQGQLTVSPAGQAYAFWHDERDRTDWKQAGNAIYFTTSNAPQSDFKASVQKLADTLCDCCRIASAFDTDGQPVWLARFIYPGGIRDQGLIKDHQNWRVTFDNWTIEACPEHGPALAISDNGNYHITWFTQGTVRQGIFYAFSSDKGRHFSTPLPLGNPEKLPSHPDVIALGQHVALAWTEFDGNKTHLMLMQSDNGGQSWQAAKAIADSTAETDFPLLLQYQQSMYVSWNSKNEGYRLLPVK
jgi:hypothetical protein